MSANSTSYSSVVLHNICEEISQTKTQNESRFKTSYAQNLQGWHLAIRFHGHLSNGSHFYTLTCECDDPRHANPSLQAAFPKSQIPFLSRERKKNDVH